MLICIDAGHGGSDPGAAFENLVEKNLNLAVALRMKDSLKKYGINPVMTREKDITLTSNDRVNIVKKCDICLSIHFNSFNTNARGVETIYQLENQEGFKLAREIATEITNDIGLPLRRVFSRESDKQAGTDYYYMHRLTKPCTVVIVECLFLDNVEDRKKLNTDELGDQIAQGLLKYLDYVEVFLHNQQLSVMGKVENGISYLPTRVLSERLGLKVDYDANRKRVYLLKG